MTQSKKILVVEDDASLAKAYNLMLSEEGYLVEVASNGIEATNKTNSTEYDLIILDILLPGIGGIEFLNKFNKNNSTKILVATNLVSPDLMNKALELGVIGYISKAETSTREIVDIVNKALND